MSLGILQAIAAIVVAIVLWLWRPRAGVVTGASEDPVMYHGSGVKLTELRPSYSDAAKREVVFATPSYCDAVIFSAGVPDIAVEMYGHSHRYLDEKYPGAFSLFDKKGYIHHVDRGAFTLHESGLSNEYVSDSAVTVVRVDVVNVAEYLRGAPVTMRTYDKVLADRAAGPLAVSRVTGRVIAHITGADQRILSATIRKMCAEIGLDVAEIGREINNDMCFTTPTVVIGDPWLGQEYFEVSAVKYYLKMDIDDAVAASHYDKRMYRQALLAAQDQYHDAAPATADEILAHCRDDLLVQDSLRGRATVVHVTGPAGSGKTTLCRTLAALGIPTYDSDDITDKYILSDGSVDNAAFYKELQTLLTPGLVVICGVVELDVLADVKLYLDTPADVVYSRLVSRTIDDICDHRTELKAAAASGDIATTAGFVRAVTTARVRFPGLVAPDMHINNDIIPKRNNYIACGYIPMASDDIVARILSLREPAQLNWTRAPLATMRATRGTAYELYKITDLEQVRVTTLTPAEFDALGVANHRARLGAKIEEIFPESDRPRGQADIDSVNYFLDGGAAEPVTVLERDNGLTKLDGVHRLVAAYIKNAPIHAVFFREKKKN